MSRLGLPSSQQLSLARAAILAVTCSRDASAPSGLLNVLHEGWAYGGVLGL